MPRRMAEAVQAASVYGPRRHHRSHPTRRHAASRPVPRPACWSAANRSALGMARCSPTRPPKPWPLRAMCCHHQSAALVSTRRRTRPLCGTRPASQHGMARWPAAVDVRTTRGGPRPCIVQQDGCRAWRGRGRTSTGSTNQLLGGVGASSKPSPQPASLTVGTRPRLSRTADGKGGLPCCWLVRRADQGQQRC